jgi:hypothetical protein
LAEVGPHAALAHIERAAKHLRRPWSLHYSTDQHAAVALRDDRPVFSMIAGRQIVTREGLEVLALATDRPFAHGRSLTDTVQDILAYQDLAVLPWGFGKWSFQRGKMIGRLLEDFRTREGSPPIFFGDNVGRPALFGFPRLLKSAHGAGIRVLAGTDPLPLASHVARVASYGFVLPQQFELPEVTAGIRNAIRSLSCQPSTFGACNSVLSCLRDQATLRLTGRRRA